MPNRGWDPQHAESAKAPAASGMPGVAVDAAEPTENHRYFRYARNIIQSSAQAIVATDFDGNIICWNQAAEELYGWTVAEALGENIFDLIGTQQSRAYTIEALEHMRHQPEWTRETVITRKDGHCFPAEVTLSQLRDDDGTLIGVIGQTVDITNRKRAEQRLGIQYAVSRLLSNAVSFEDVAQDLLHAICEQIKWHWCAIWLVDASGQMMRYVASWCEDRARFKTFVEATEAFHPRRGEGLAGSVWDAGEQMWVEHIPDQPWMKRTDEARETGLTSAMAVPIRLGTREVHGVIELMSLEPHPLDEALIEMVSAAARQMGLFLERQHAIDSMVEHESRLRTLEEFDLIGILRANLDGAILDANDAFLNMIGYSREDLEAGLRWDDLTPDEWRAVDNEIIKDIVNTGRSPQREKEYVRKDGSRIAVLLGSAQLPSDTREVVTFVVDISTRKQAEHEREESLLREQEARLRARDAQHKAELLLEVTAAFSRARTQEDVAEVTVTEGMSALGATGCSFTLLNESGDALRLVAFTGYGPGTLDNWKNAPLDLNRGFPITECVLRAESMWVPTIQDLFDRFPTCREVKFAYSASIAAIPLIVHGRAVGAVNLGYAEEHAFTESERVFAETLVQFCGQALERAWLFEGEQRAREQARAAQRRAEQLLAVTASLSRALTPAEVAEVTIEQGLRVLGVAAGVIALLDEDSNALRIVHSSGFDEDTVERWLTQPISLDRHVPVVEAVKTGEAVWIESREALFERYPIMEERDGVNTQALAAVPLIAGNRTYGVLGLNYHSSHEMDRSERTYARTLARLTSQALERAQLFARERDARVTAEDARQRLSLLAGAGELLTASLDMHTTLDLIARLVVPWTADWCVIDVLGERGLPERVTVMHSDPEKIRWAKDLQSRYPFNPDAPSGIAKVLRTGEPELHPVITDEMLQSVAQDEEHLRIIRAVGISSAIIVPMIARGRSVGAITMVHSESGRRYDESDLALVEDIAYRAALAVDNSRLYLQAQQHAARMDSIAEAARLFTEAGHSRQAIVDALSRHVTEIVGDWAVVRLPSDDGRWLDPVSIHHDDPVARQALSDMFASDPLRWDEGMTGQVAVSGESLIIPEIDPETLRQRLKPGYRHWLDRYAMYAVLIVPLRRRERVVGTIALFRGSPDRPYTEADRQFVQNVADRAALALENAQLFHQAQEAVRLREEFLSIASHEMRTPLTTITGFAHLLDRQIGKGQLDIERLTSISGSLLSETRRLDQLVADLLDISRIQQNRLDIRPESCDLAVILHEVVSRITESQEIGANRDIVTHAPDAVPGVWDPLRIDQVITNLLTNALKYAADGQITLTAIVEDDGIALLRVQDQGVGIPESQLPRLFEPFVRGADAHHRASGTGLGLYITRKIIEEHGGTIEVESEQGLGSVFTVRLPVHPEIADA